jgi:ElaB/YqjD/DUF883 family membrane-anchored ribosome-binding protein
MDRLALETTNQIQHLSLEMKQLANDMEQLAIKTTSQIQQLSNETTSQIQQLANETTSQIQQLGNDMEQLAIKTTSQIQQLSNETSSQIQQLANETTSQIQQLGNDMEQLAIKTTSQIQQLSNETTSQIQQLGNSMNTEFQSLNTTIRNGFISYHDFEYRKVNSLTTVTKLIDLCDNLATIHFVIRDEFVFGISVKHNLCNDCPTYIHMCPNHDISIHRICPDENRSVLNITSVANAEIGHKALGYGFHNRSPRIWSGLITGYLGERYSTNASEECELLYQGDQLPGMSGGAVLNGRGNLILFVSNSN